MDENSYLLSKKKVSCFGSLVVCWLFLVSGVCFVLVEVDYICKDSVIKQNVIRVDFGTQGHSGLTVTAITKVPDDQRDRGTTDRRSNCPDVIPTSRTTEDPVYDPQRPCTRIRLSGPKTLKRKSQTGLLRH